MEVWFLAEDLGIAYDGEELERLDISRLRSHSKHPLNNRVMKKEGAPNCLQTTAVYRTAKVVGFTFHPS